jgi:thiamine-monophosphate kinase
MSPTERQVIQTILDKVTKYPKMLLPYGDDAVAIPCGAGAAVLKADMLVKATDIPQGMTIRQMAMKAVTATVSDMAAKGVQPTALLISLALPSNTTPGQVEELASGLNEAAALYDTYILGGDVNEGSDIIIDCIAFGHVDPTKLTPRNGAQPGDIVATTGFYGGPPAALKLLQERVGKDLPQSIQEKLLTSLYEPRAHLKEGLRLAGLASASIDSSDGLVWSLHEISDMSHIKILLSDIPVSSEVYYFADRTGSNPLDLAFYGGEEYTLIVTIPPQRWEQALQAIKSIGGQLYKIGTTTTGEGLYYKESDGSLRKLKVKGWEHLKR